MDILDVALSSITFLTRTEKFLLKKNIDSLDALSVLSIEDIAGIIGRTPKKAIWNAREAYVSAVKGFELMDAQGIKGVCFSEADYPALLRELLDAPYMLFYRGNLNVLHKACISIVGTRRLCSFAAEKTFEFAKDATLNGYTVVSGLADGVDSFAHKGALSSKLEGVTAAVLPCGIDTVVPSGNKVLAKNILASGGVLVSEYIPGSPAEAWRFVQRNRIIAYLSPSTVITQAPAGSGALITADFALEGSRDVVLHESCFCKEAKEQNERAKKMLVARGAKAKAGRTLDALVQEGAPIIGNYEDYVAFRKDEPGKHTAFFNI